MLKGASGLRSADLNGKSDPYVTLSLCGVQHRSRVVPRSLNPRWDEMFEFEGSLRDLTSELLQVVVLDRDCITRDDPLGSASVSLFDLRSVREKVVEAELSTKGRVSLVITWTAHGDAWRMIGVDAAPLDIEASIARHGLFDLLATDGPAAESLRRVWAQARTMAEAVAVDIPRRRHPRVAGCRSHFAPK